MATQTTNWDAVLCPYCGSANMEYLILDICWRCHDCGEGTDNPVTGPPLFRGTPDDTQALVRAREVAAEVDEPRRALLAEAETNPGLRIVLGLDDPSAEFQPLSLSADDAALLARRADPYPYDVTISGGGYRLPEEIRLAIRRGRP